MKNFVITIMDNEKSVKSAERCIKSGYSVGGLEIEKWPATTPRDDINMIAANEGINTTAIDEVYSRTSNCLAAFLSHYRLWKWSMENNEEITIFEHDAVCVNVINSIIPYHGCISLGKPSYGKYNTPAKLGVNKLTSKPYFPGAHAYRLKPKAADIFIQHARMEARPTDVFLNNVSFPFLQEYYPWVVEAKDTFTTIQNKNGIAAKHNKVEIINA
jgi:GR25 family glycosyltransferase involved in LPS biosynthesis